jgi:hyperosmotically inducible periplasmic protein
MNRILKSFGVAGLALAASVGMAAQASGQSAGNNGQSGGNAATNSSQDIPVIPGTKQSISGGSPQEQRIAKEVRHEIAMLPYYSLFDDLRFRVNGANVTLLGDVTNPTLKSDAEGAVKHIEGVEHVTNNINVLPPSPMDDQIRREVARRIANYGGLSRYFWEASPSIHIIVQNGRVRLTGVVDNQGDRTQAEIQAKSVPNVFGVTDDLQVAGGGGRE